jgi:hypothetical protein
MTKILSLLIFLIQVTGCANPIGDAVYHSVKGNHAEAARHYLLAAEQAGKGEEYAAAHAYCSAASEFQKAGDNVRNAIASAEKGVAKYRVLIERLNANTLREMSLMNTKEMFVCKLILAEGRLSHGDHEGVRELVTQKSVT